MHQTRHQQFLLNRLRLGTIVGSEHLAADTTSTTKAPAFDGHAVAVLAPSRLVEALIVDGATLHQRFAVYSADEGREYAAVITIQRAGTQLNIVLPMSDAGVKTYLTDTIERGLLQVILMHEDGEYYSLLQVDTPFHEPQRLQAMMLSACPHRSGISALAEMTIDIAKGRAVPSLVEGQAVDQMLAVLAGSEVSPAMHKAFGRGTQAPHRRFVRMH